ncbi:MAG: tRNA pseudouridine(38-40) synthase TruA [Candidatus Rhabdochlamydia sp.]
MNHFKLIVAYEGTRYLGWQKTEAGPTIQESIEKVLEQMLQHPVKLQAASRTDRGVHAEGQVIHFFTEKKRSLQSLQLGLNALLPPDIRIVHIEPAALSFHPTLSATQKEYHYQVCLGQVQLPFHRSFSWHFPKVIHVAKMQEAIPFFVGEKDFSALTNEKKQNNVCNLLDIQIHTLEDHRLIFHIHGNRFLYKMVRNIVGTLLYIGCERILPTEIPQFLELQDRRKMGMTAPAHGLSLKRVCYD